MRAFLFCSLILLMPMAAAEQWRVVGDEQFAPYSFVTSDDNTPRGLDVELVAAVLDEAGVPYQLRLYPWQRVKRMLGRGEADMAFQFAGTPERHAEYRLVGPIRTGSTVFITSTRTAIQDWQTFDDLSPFVIGQVRGYAYEDAFDHADLARDITAQNPRQLVSMLLAGRIDIIVGDHAQLMYFAREQRAEERVRVLPRPLVEMPRFVAFEKSDAVRAERFSDALQRLQGRDALAPILQRWNP